MKHFFGIFTTAMVLLLAGCASVPMAPLDQDIQAKEFLPAPSKASLYIYRNESFGAAIPMTVSVNGKVLGQTAAKTYFRLNVVPGKYSVESHSENVSSLPLSVEAGKNYFVWQEVKMGMWTPRSLLQQVNESTGRAGVTESKLIAFSVSDKDLTPLDTPINAPLSASPAPPGDSVNQKLRELQNLQKDGVITEEEFQKKKQQLLEKL
ncbi:DUF2846 domain-containing protein [Polaromonas jejuensis]|uniref:DUF2846 domain-containing protein n=1 Tax=Polaromonas jejuensis TaxID=457502 RepID=A0ABW0Q3Q5_9BURK|nr:DUF2846 domain-containing protein [Polaromonas jejuensis]